jgi:DNA-binding response OmpR family regulator
MNACPLASLGSVLTICAQDWARRFGAYLESEWNPATVEELHEEVDRLALDSDAVGEHALSEAAIELSAYLCSFVDDSKGPNAAQRERLVRLTRTLVVAVGGPPPAVVTGAPAKIVALVPAEPDPTPREGIAPPVRNDGPLPHILCVAEDVGVVADLAVALSAHGIALTANSPSNPLAYVPETGVHCVVVDAGALGVLHDLERSWQALSRGLAKRPSYVALVPQGDTNAHLHALRAGADHVVPYAGDATAVAGRLAAVLSAGSKSPLRVLLIDDDRSHSMFCESILRRFGMETMVCSDPEKAVAMFGEHEPDVVLVDLYMPQIDGLALTGRLLETPGSEHASILFLSGDPEPETRFDALAAGGDDFLSKPIQPRHLIRAVIGHGKRAQRRKARHVA